MAIVFGAGIAVYVLFVAARALVAAAARVPDRLPPFGEAPLARLTRASIATRLALTLAGPLAVYLPVVALWTVGIHGTGAVDESRVCVDVAPAGPAAAAGVRDGDCIKALGGAPLTRFTDIRPALAKRAGDSVDLLIEREGRELHVLARIDAAPPWNGRLGVTPRAEEVAWGAAFRKALAAPFAAITAHVQAALHPVARVLSGPVGIVEAVRFEGPRKRAARLANVAAVAGTTALAGLVIVALFLFPFGARRPSRPERESAPELAAAPRRRPWVRLAARLVDQALLLLLAAAVLFAAGPGPLELASGLLVFLAIPIEAVLLASWGYTPGKWLLRVAVRDASGRKLRVGAALRRTAAVWAFGLAVNQTIGLVTGALSWYRLQRRGSTYWDALDGHRVDHGPIGGGRGAVAFLIIAAFVVFAIAVAAQ